MNSSNRSLRKASGFIMVIPIQEPSRRADCPHDEQRPLNSITARVSAKPAVRVQSESISGLG
jgi:hypothetical protein